MERWSTKSDDELNRLLNDLQLGEFIYEQPAVGDTEYIFKHALTQEVAYNSVLMERRQQLHERAGAALETLYASTVEEHLAELAHHYGRSANPGKAVEYLTRAGQQALNRSAYAEAQAQLQQGLEWIKKLAESPERDARELELASTLAQVLLVTRGYTAPETRAAAERARDLAEKSGNLAQLVVQVFGIWRSVNGLGRLLHRRPAGGPDTRPRPARGQSRELWLRLPCSGARELLSRRPRRSRGALRALERLP